MVSAGNFLSLLVELLPGEFGLSEQQLTLCARHLELVLEANQRFNLTRITEPREAVIKHVLDSLLPAERFAAAGTLLDLGSGAGFPGIPLAILFPQAEVWLVESTGKKARFLKEAVRELGLDNVRVEDRRGEDLLKSLPPDRIEILTARAVGSIEKLLNVLRPVKNRFGKLLLFKGRQAAEEIEAAGPLARQLKLNGEIVFTYALPESMGTHCIVEYRHQR
jgi:16S rRNA (guanine527-N7)-methyltransferase